MSQSCHHSKKKWYSERLFLVSAAGVLGLIITHIMNPSTMLIHHFINYLYIMGWAVLLGLFLGGIIDYFLPQEYIVHVLARPKKRTIVYSVALGFCLSACSHGVLAIAMQLYKKGAAISSVIAFLLASPWANLPVTFLLVGFFGWKAFIIIGFAIILAVITGLVYQIIEGSGWLDDEKNTQAMPPDPHFSMIVDIKKRWAESQWGKDETKMAVTGVLKGMWTLSKMVLWWIILGMVFASFIQSFIPQETVMHYMGATPLGVGVTLLVATLLEVCSEGTAPVAFELYRNTYAFGNVLIFLMAGVSTDYTEIGLLWTNIGKKTAILLPLITVPFIIIFGILLN